ncbi:hypothetical protein BDA96_02G006800 [Sorghum bicolor]|jgi:hypothetical protein|nr:hypothetical protein BDA96_02G006800 [Sorghum bicolor]
MAAPADGSTTISQDEEAVPLLTMPVPRAIQLVMAMISSSGSTTNCKTIEENGGVGSIILWMKLVLLPSILIFYAAGTTYHVLCHDDHDAGGDLRFLPVAVGDLLSVYMAVVHAAGGHLGFSAPRMPYAAWEILHKVGYEGIGILLLLISIGVVVLGQPWPLLVALVYLLGLLVASTIAFWLCLLRTYGGSGGGEPRRDSSSCAEAVIDGLAYLYSRILYEFVVRFPAVTAPDPHPGGRQQQQLNAAHVAV